MRLQHTIPTVIVTFPNPTMGISSLIMCCRVASEVNHVGRFWPHMKNTDVINSDVRHDRRRALYDANRAMLGLPLPRWYATRIEAASERPSEDDSNIDQILPRIPQVATDF